MLAIEQLVVMADLTDVERVGESAINSRVLERPATACATSTRYVGLGTVTSLIERLRRPLVAVGLQVGLVDEQDQITFLIVHGGDSWVVRIDIVAQDLTAVLQSLRRPPGGLLTRPLRGLLSLQLCHHEQNFQHCAARGGAGALKISKGSAFNACRQETGA